MMSIEKATCHVLAYCEETGNIKSTSLLPFKEAILITNLLGWI